MRLSRALANVAHASPALVWSMITRPRFLLSLPGRPPSSSTEDAAIALFPDASRQFVDQLRLEFLNHEDLWLDLNRAMVAQRRRHVNPAPWNEFLYVLVRIARPAVFVETGVFDGQSSAIILQAMEDNGSGELYSIDLPATRPIEGSTHRMRESSLPPGQQPGWLVPERLRPRYHLRLGDARQLVPQLLDELPEIGAFFHDSLHTYDHMRFEYEAAWPHLVDGGLLISDDIHWNHAFDEFARKVGRSYVRVQTFGAMRR